MKSSLNGICLESEAFYELFDHVVEQLKDKDNLETTNAFFGGCEDGFEQFRICLLYTSPSPRD